MEPSPFEANASAGEFFTRAREQQSSGDFSGLLTTARALVERFPRKASGFNLVAIALKGLGRFEEAMEAVQRGIALHPNDSKLHRTKLALHVQAGHVAEVLKYAGLLADPSHPIVTTGILFDLASYQMSAHDFDAAASTARTIVALGPEASAFGLLAQALLNSNKSKEALAVALDGIAAYPGETKLHWLAHNIHLQLGNLEEALAHARQVAKSDPADLKALSSIYKSLMGLGRIDEAAQHLEVAREASPDFEYGKNAFHLNQYRTLQRDVPAVAAAWEAGLGKPVRRYAADGRASAIPVIQYWSQGEPPVDVRFVIGVWNGILAEQGIGPVEVYDRGTARLWIEQHAPEFSTAFAQAFHYAMESDIFRIAYASRLECIYLDIDSWPAAGIGAILGYGLRSPHSMLYFRTFRPSLNNSFFIARRNCPFFGELIRQCLAIDLETLPQLRGTIDETFGPARYNAVLQEVAANCAVRSVSAVGEVSGLSELLFEDGTGLLFANEFATAAQKPPFVLHYKGTDDYWKAVSVAG